jgi:hypothetical protein
MNTVDERAPLEVGLKITVTVHVPLGATVPQLFVCEKSPAFPPTIETDDTDSDTVPVFVTVTAWPLVGVPTLELPKLREEGDKPTVGRTPVPDRLTVRGDPVESSVTVSVAVRDPVPVGVNPTSTVQLLLTASVDEQLLVSVKSAAFVPLIAIDEMLIETVPVFVTVTVWFAVAVPTFVLANVKLDGATVSVGATPVPDSEEV